MVQRADAVLLRGRFFFRFFSGQDYNLETGCMIAPRVLCVSFMLDMLFFAVSPLRTYPLAFSAGVGGWMLRTLDCYRSFPFASLFLSTLSGTWVTAVSGKKTVNRRCQQIFSRLQTVETTAQIARRGICQIAHS